MEPDLTTRLKSEALRLGFDQVGIAPAVSPPTYPHYLDWLEAGHAAGMGYLERQAEARAHPDRLLEGVRSVVIMSFVYGRPESEPAGPTQGKVARYARAVDYHEVFWRRIESLLDWLKAEEPGVRGRAVSDTAPLLERDFARRAGLGWVGKNTMLIDRRLGSFTLLGALLLDVELKYDPPHESSHCGTCTRCLDACPTDAFTGPYQLDARRCISYWTIEHKGPIPNDVAGQLDGWVFGCDICQNVCPWNRKAAAGKEPALDPGVEWAHPNLVDWLTEAPATFSKAIKGTALARAKRSGLLRNAASVLGASGEETAVPALANLLDDPDPVIRSSVAWALGRIASTEAIHALEAHGNEQDPLARDAIQRALIESGSVRQTPTTPSETK
ncbi:tRNA epoxyqueuosine(34) reductase QueG [Singulisphaera sp. Ch08]|uniref:tRNA epoxyqueuosine(34) reductase QueG n=1 Tax=Singulisphaera sp. Ch08 TaxID=3120278 RepID=A0AAU7CC01_9BACT